MTVYPFVGPGGPAALPPSFALSLNAAATYARQQHVPVAPGLWCCLSCFVEWKGDQGCWSCGADGLPRYSIPSERLGPPMVNSSGPANPATGELPT